MRLVAHADAFAWLAENPAAPFSSVVTSLPDVSEVPAMGFEGWRTWFIEAAYRVIAWLPPSGVAIFYQSDVVHRGTWIDKSYLVQRALERTEATLAWHAIVCRKPPGTIARGRATYTHMLCVRASAITGAITEPANRGPDVLDAGAMPWSKAMGVEACRAACAYLKRDTQTRTVVDPFCGRGTVLAVAEELGFEAIGVDISAKRCRAARKLSIADLAH